MLGENWAELYLRRKGYRVRHKNYRCGRGELDLVVWDRDHTLVFVEVKSARSREAGDPSQWVTPTKVKKLVALAQRYCYHQRLGPIKMRFDVIACQFRGNESHIEHIRNAFLA